MKDMNKKRTVAVLSATALLFSSGVGMTSLTEAKAENLNSVTIAVDEEFEDLNILTRTKGSYSADMVHTMIYDRLLRLNEDGSFAPDLLESWEPMGEESGENVPLDYLPITTTPGWEAPLDLTDVSLREFYSEAFIVCTLREGVTFQNYDELTVDDLIALVNFAKAQPTDTLIYQTWAPVSIEGIDAYTFLMTIDTEGFNFGFMDVMYNLASPQGSIVYVGDQYSVTDGYPVGTGAYQLQTVTGNTSVSFERWSGWWSTETVPTQYVTFQYMPDSSMALTYLSADPNAIAVMRYGEAEEETLTGWSDAYEEWYDLWTEQSAILEGNPLALVFNTETGSMFSETRYRQAATAALGKDAIRAAGGLDHDSNDFWSYLTDNQETVELDNSTLEDARSLIEGADSIVGFYEVNVIVYDDIYFSNYTYRQYYTYVRIAVEQYLNDLFGFYDIEVNIITTDECGMAEYEENGNYDIMIKEIDLHNINSAHNALYGKGSQDVDDWLTHASNSVDSNSFMLSHLAAQWYNYKDYAFVTPLGWQKRAIVWNENVSGISVLSDEGFCPTGDSSTVDFRFVSVATN